MDEIILILVAMEVAVLETGYTGYVCLAGFIDEAVHDELR